ncbi:hypothetical protein BH11PLA1_BH11PLA1_05310 [soil metagenome]
MSILEAGSNVVHSETEVCVVRAETPIGVVTLYAARIGVREVRICEKSALDQDLCRGGRGTGDGGAIERRSFGVAVNADDGVRARALHWLRQICAWIEAPRGPLEVPLECGGTAFQGRVWDALRRIPSGETRTYGGIAAALRPPSVARAVAGACAANRAALLVPCHRVVGMRGDLTGFRWGIGVKRELLRRERAANGGVESSLFGDGSELKAQRVTRARH